MTSSLLETMMSGDTDEMQSCVSRQLNESVPPSAILDELTSIIKTVGDMFERGEVFLPELMLAGEAMDAAVSQVMPTLSRTTDVATKGTVVVATVKGDVHDIGKNVVATFLRARGFEVHDLGRDVSAETMLEKARQVSADIIAVSTLLTSTMGNAADVGRLIAQDDALPRYMFVVGGAPVTPEWAESIGADGTAETAPAAADLCEHLAAMRRLEAKA